MPTRGSISNENGCGFAGDPGSLSALAALPTAEATLFCVGFENERGLTACEKFDGDLIVAGIAVYRCDMTQYQLPAFSC
jgi:hypothetical protein